MNQGSGIELGKLEKNISPSSTMYLLIVFPHPPSLTVRQIRLYSWHYFKRTNGQMKDERMNQSWLAMLTGLTGPRAWLAGLLVLRHGWVGLRHGWLGLRRGWMALKGGGQTDRVD